MRAPHDCPEAEECDVQLCSRCAEWEHQQGWHEEAYVDVCPRCRGAVIAPERLSSARGAKGGE